MKVLLILALGSGLLSSVLAQKNLQNHDWRQLPVSDRPEAGGVSEIDGRSALRIANTNDTPLHVRLLTIGQPPITRRLYALIGELKYSDVHGDGFLEMWSCFPPPKEGMPEARYFSRTLDVSGRLGRISGSSNWRPFELPFDRMQTTEPPTRLEVNLILPGRGTVVLGPLSLIEYEGDWPGGAGSTGNAWWSVRSAALLGGIGGAGFGCLAALAGWLASKGRARGFVMTSLGLLIALGILSLAAGLAALAVRQPYAVWYPLLLLGALALLILPFRLRAIHRQYAELELRRMASLDASSRL